MFDTVLMKNAITLFMAAMIINLIIFVLISFVSMIYNRILFKTAVKQWVIETKYFLLVYFFAWFVMIFMMLFMFLGFKGIFAAVLILTLGGATILNIREKRGAAIYFSESTTYKCKCGGNITLFTKITASGKHKPLYYICQNCGAKHSENELDGNG